MLRKIVISLIFGFFFQSLLSCYDSCNTDPGIKEMIYTSMDLLPGVKIGGDFTPFEDSVRKENFNLIVSFIETEKALAHSRQILRLGFNSIQAEDCIPDYLYINTVQSLKVSMLNQDENSQYKDVTEYFVVKAQNENYSIEEIIKSQSPSDGGGNYFPLSLVKYDSIYKNAIFKVTVTLESGETFTKETETIIFID